MRAKKTLDQIEKKNQFATQRFLFGGRSLPVAKQLNYILIPQKLYYILHMNGVIFLTLMESYSRTTIFSQKIFPNFFFYSIKVTNRIRRKKILYATEWAQMTSLN